MYSVSISTAEVEKLFALTEGHFADFKGIAIAPGKLTRSISAFANADGGEFFVGIEEPSSGGPKTWNGFESVEAANGLIQAVASVLPLGQGCRMTFIAAEGLPGLVLQIEVFKSRDIIKSNGGEVYVRRGAQNLPVTEPEALGRLRLNKGLSSQLVPLIRVRWNGEFASIVTAGGQAASANKVYWQERTRKDPIARLRFARDLIHDKALSTVATMEDHLPRSAIWNVAF